MLPKYVWDNTRTKKITCAMFPQITQTCFRRKITYTILKIARKLPVQCLPTAHEKFWTEKQSAMLPWSVWANIAQRNYLHSVGSWLTDNFYEENNVYNFVSTMLGQHGRGISYAPCCPNTFETTLHRKTTCLILALSAETCYCRKTSFAMLSWSAWANIAQTNYLRNADNFCPQSIV